MQTDILKKKVRINTYSLTLQTKLKSYLKNTMMLGMELKIKSKK